MNIHGRSSFLNSSERALSNENGALAHDLGSWGYNKFGLDCKPPAWQGVHGERVESSGNKSSSAATYDVMNARLLVTILLSSATNVSAVRRWFS
jgi:hypothetical protein